MASDTPPGMDYAARRQHHRQPQRGRRDDLRDHWEKLVRGGTVTMPLEKQMWGDEFGMCTDRFGIPWLVNIGQPQG